MAHFSTPLIDREVFFGNPEIAGGKLSPDGSFVSFMKEYKGIMNIWIKPFDAPFEKAKLLTNSTSPIPGYFWTYDGKYILYVNDNGGDENFNIYAIDPQSPPEGEVPPSRNLTPMEEVTATIYQVSKKNPDKLMIGLNDRDKAWHDLYELTISTGTLSLLFENTNRMTGWVFDWDEKLRLAYRTDENGYSQILRVDENGSSFKKIYETNLQENAYVAGWNPDNSACYLVSNKGEVDLSTLYLMDPMDGSSKYVESDPEKKVDFGGIFIDENSREVIYTSYVYDKLKRHWKNKEWEQMFAHLKEQFPNREVGFSSMTTTYDKFLIAVSGDKYATDVFFFDRQTRELIHQYTPRPKLKEYEGYLARMQPIEYKSSDGLLIQGYLSIPYGMEEKNLPTVVLVHGGPKGPRDVWGYDSQVQLLTNRGYAVLQPNFRASGGYGKAFMNAGDREWGKKMQDDITFGVKYLIHEGIADPQRIAIMGGSYGGYATLAGLAYTPDLYACGIDIVGPSNLFTLLESIPPYWEAGRKWLYEMVGDPDTDEGQRLLKEASPLFSVDRIKSPLLIIQGANDPRVKKAEADQIAIAMRDNGHEVEYLLAEDEGHGFRKPLNRKAMWAESEKFLALHIGGRYQEDMPEDVAKALEKLRVDIASVTYSPPGEKVAVHELPEIKNAWTEGSAHHQVTIEVQGQSIPMELNQTINRQESTWRVTHTASSPMLGESIDEVVYDQDFRPLSRTITQGGHTTYIQYDGNKVKMEGQGKEKELQAEGIVLVDGPGYGMILGAWGLEEGEEVSFFVVDPTRMKLKQVLANMLPKEEWKSGTCERIDVIALDNDQDKTSFWIEPNSGQVLREEKVLPAMQNAKMTIVAI